MSRLLLVVTLVPSLLAACGDDAGSAPDAGSPDAGVRRLVLFHTNDEHSHLFAFAPEIDDRPVHTTPGDGTLVGGVARRATLLAEERAVAAAAGIDTLTVSAGDETQGALPQLAFTTTAPDFTILERLGYDVMCPGNHEFDRGPGAFAAAISAARSHGGLPQLVSTNIQFDDADDRDDTLEALYGEGNTIAAIKRYHVVTTPSGIRVGFFGSMGIEASFYAPLKTPVRFSAESANEGDTLLGLPRLYDDLRPTVTALREVEQVDLVVLLSHGGVNEAVPELGDDYQVAQHVEGIDVIVSGHSHTPLAEPIVVAAPDGYLVPIVQAGSYGQWVGRLELVLTPGARPTFDPAGSRLLPVDDRIVPTDQAILDELEGLVQTLETADAGDGRSALEQALSAALGVPVEDDPNVIGDLYWRDLGATSFDVIGRRSFQETNILNLSTDSMLTEAEALAGPTLVGVQASGAVRGDILAGATGVMSFADLYRIFPLGVNPLDGTIGYPLCRFYLWAVEIKAAFEVAASQGLVSDSFFLGASGLRVEFDTSRPEFDFANALEPTNGRVTKILVDIDHTDGFDNPTVVLFDLARADPFASPLGDIVTLHPVVTTFYVASFAETAGVTLKDAAGDGVTLESTILERADGTAVKDWEVFVSYVHEAAAANAGFLPSRYDENTPEGALPRRLVCSGPLCP